MTQLVETVGKSIQRQRLLKSRQSVLVAVSGGLDSMVLLHVLHELSRSFGWKLFVAHLNHRLRGRSSDADERLVVRQARKLRLPVVTSRADVRKAARDGKLSIEMAARQVRHQFLAREALRLNIRAIALAHHADDQVELFFLRLLRGSGNEGLAGMKWTNPSPADSTIHLIRPLLDQSRSALRQFAAERRVLFREDASNASLDMQRNRIRHELLPLLRRKYQPALNRTVTRVMEIAGSEGELAGQLAEEWLRGKRRTSFGELPVAIQRRCIQIQLRTLAAGSPGAIAVDYDLVERLRTRPNHPAKVSPHLSVMLTADGVLDFQESKTVATNPARCELELGERAGETTFDGVKIAWRFVSTKSRGRPRPRPGCEVFDAAEVGSCVVLRHWLPGDRFQPSGMRSPVKLQDLFTNLKIPREQRHRLIVATTERDELFWVEALRISEHFKVSDRTIRRLQWQWMRL